MELPSTLINMLRIAEVAVSFGMGGISTPLACLGLGGYPQLLRFWMSLPAVLIACILLGAVGTIRMRRRQLTVAGLVELALPLTLRVLFLIYPIITNVAFDGFPCYKFSDGSQYLKADLSVSCNDDEYVWVVLPMVWTAIIIYPIGLIVLNAALLFCARSAIMERRETMLSRATAFLHKEYESHLFWWELVEMLRRFVLCGLMVIVYNGTILQLVLGTVIAGVMLFFQAQASPFKNIDDDYVASASAFSLLIMLVCMIAFKNTKIFGIPDIQAKMSPVQRTTFIVNTDVITFVAIGSLFVSLLFAIVLLTAHLAAEARRAREEAGKTRARRLRYVKDNSEVPAPSLDTGQMYHLFLSHVWSTGQDNMRVVKQRLLEIIPLLRIFLDVSGLPFLAVLMVAFPLLLAHALAARTVDALVGGSRWQVDDLEDISDLQGYIERTHTVLIYCSQGYFQSKVSASQIFCLCPQVHMSLELRLTCVDLTFLPPHRIASSSSDQQCQRIRPLYPCSTLMEAVVVSHTGRSAIS